MALRKMTGVERKKVRAMAASLLFGGELKDDVRTEVVRYLVARGWDRAPALIRARETVDAAGARE